MWDARISSCPGDEAVEALGDGLLTDFRNAISGFLIEEDAGCEVVLGCRKKFGVALTAGDLKEPFKVTFHLAEFRLDDFVVHFLAVNDECHRRRWNVGGERARAERPEA